MVSLGLYIQDFRDFLLSGDGQRWLADADEKKKSLQAALSKENFPKLAEENMREVLVRLESLSNEKASETFSVLMRKYGLEDVKGELYYLLYGERPLEERYDEVRKGIPELPFEVLLEIATFAVPRDFCIWNEASRQMLVFVGHSRMYGLSEKAFKGDVSGWDYVHCKSALNHVREQLRSYLQRKVDFVDVHLFSRYMLENEVSKIMKATTATKSDR